ncbi:hypothetical protein FisN_14Lh190 [Fistulifera solaris]|uniref:AB hydrolase-1 domain-containing protein n=1 Tax=Fistulifera solaris TaxID=1519565 RepID=A0A1Z5J9N7_FISSO|nr:hypothetical protein FisN_14Lh190 [Fistulifera solaris]|eukprot:GAX10679.1 hypothetical protein FisN_14Lh190 [Fistulifera solaris]
MLYPVSLLSRSFPKCVPLIRRNLLTLMEEPALTSLVPERPCTIVLAEDEGFNSQSWNTWRPSLVQEHGFSFAQCSITANDDFDAALRELSNDLSHGIAPHVVLLSRGPMISWLAQFYLESLPLQGLIMVDPLPLDHGESVQALEHYYYATTSESLSLFNDYVEHYAHWTMRLEPGSVPMMILATQNDNDIYWKGALRTKERHDGEGMHVKIVKSDDEDDMQTEVIRWITDEVL